MAKTTTVRRMELLSPGLSVVCCWLECLFASRNCLFVVFGLTNAHLLCLLSVMRPNCRVFLCCVVFVCELFFVLSCSLLRSFPEQLSFLNRLCPKGRVLLCDFVSLF